jgi:hypothetical protein
MVKINGTLKDPIAKLIAANTRSLSLQHLPLPIPSKPSSRVFETHKKPSSLLFLRQQSSGPTHLEPLTRVRISFRTRIHNLLSSNSRLTLLRFSPFNVERRGTVWKVMESSEIRQGKRDTKWYIHNRNSLPRLKVQQGKTPRALS